MEVLFLQCLSLLIAIFSSAAAQKGYSLEGRLLISDGKVIRLYDPNGKMLKVIAQKNSQSIDYDCSSNEIVWTNLENDYNIYVKGDKLTTLPKPKELWIPKSVAVDSINHKIYVAENLSKSILLYDRAKKNYITIFQANQQVHNFLWQVAVDPKEGYLFIQNDFEIIRTNLDGVNLKMIYLETEEGDKREWQITNMTRFSIDTQFKRLLWLNDETGAIWSMNYEGEERKVVFQKNIEKQGHMLDSVTVINSILYWADAYNQKLIKVDLNSPAPAIVYDLGSVVPESIKGVSCTK